MRCPKCGFNSFDYLAECKKCGTDLGNTRQELGIAGQKPAMPFLLGALLKDHGSAQAAAKEGSEADLFSDFQQASAGLDVHEQSQEHAPGDAGDIELDLSEQPKSPSPPGQSSTSGSFSDDGISIDLSDEAADWSLLDVQMEEAATPASEKMATAVPEDDLSGTGSKKTDEAMQNDIIELTEEDLEGLFLELEDSDDKENEDSK